MHFYETLHILFDYQSELSRVKLIIHGIIDRRPNKSALPPFDLWGNNTNMRKALSFRNVHTEYGHNDRKIYTEKNQIDTLKSEHWFYKIPENHVTQKHRDKNRKIDPPKPPFGRRATTQFRSLASIYIYINPAFIILLPLWRSRSGRTDNGGLLHATDLTHKRWPSMGELIHGDVWAFNGTWIATVRHVRWITMRWP